MWDSRVHVGVAALIDNFDDKSRLMIKRSTSASHGADQWAVPGGWIDYRESPEKALIRECKEEIGVDIYVGRLVTAVTNTYPPPVDSAVCLFYRANIAPHQIPEIMEPDKIEGLVWTNWSVIPDLDLFPPIRSLLHL